MEGIITKVEICKFRTYLNRLRFEATFSLVKLEYKYEDNYI